MKFNRFKNSYELMQFLSKHYNIPIVTDDNYAYILQFETGDRVEITQYQCLVILSRDKRDPLMIYSDHSSFVGLLKSNIIDFFNNSVLNNRYADFKHEHTFRCTLTF